VDRFLAQYSERVYAVMRIMVGLLFLCYGLQKALRSVRRRKRGRRADLFALRGCRVDRTDHRRDDRRRIGDGKAAFIASGHMAAAYFIAHAPNGFWPIENGGVAALLFCFIFLFMATRGSGLWSVDALLRRA
jgi:putative oxidoreductase